MRSSSAIRHVETMNFNWFNMMARNSHWKQLMCYISPPWQFTALCKTLECGVLNEGVGPVTSHYGVQRWILLQQIADILQIHTYICKLKYETKNKTRISNNLVTHHIARIALTVTMRNSAQCIYTYQYQQTCRSSHPGCFYKPWIIAFRLFMTKVIAGRSTLPDVDILEKIVYLAISRRCVGYLRN